MAWAEIVLIEIPPSVFFIIADGAGKSHSKMRPERNKFAISLAKHLQ
jgi:hypothetical protein